jgi:hypothetical protein
MDPHPIHSLRTKGTLELRASFIAALARDLVALSKQAFGGIVVR